MIGLGEHDTNSGKIKVLVDAANTDENNWCAGRARRWGSRRMLPPVSCAPVPSPHAVAARSRSSYAPIPEGVAPSDALMSSPILTGVAAGAGGAAGAGQFAQYGGVNPDLDPELAMVRCRCVLRCTQVPALTSLPSRSHTFVSRRSRRRWSRCAKPQRRRTRPATQRAGRPRSLARRPRPAPRLPRPTHPALRLRRRRHPRPHPHRWIWMTTTTTQSFAWYASRPFPGQAVHQAHAHPAVCMPVCRL